MTIHSSGTIQEIASKLAEAKQAELAQRDDLDGEATIFMLGSPEVGKTTIINAFLDKEPSASSVRPTLALDYSFARRTTTSPSAVGGTGGGGGGGVLHQHRSRPVCHVWELGGALLNDSPPASGIDTTDLQHNLCDIPMRSARHGLRQMRIVLVLDLSQPDRIWADLTRALHRLDAAFRRADRSGGSGSGVEYAKAQANRWRLANEPAAADDGGDGADGELVAATAASGLASMPAQYFPVPLLLIGGKYDVFQNFDPEIKKHICRALRSVALLLGANALLFVSTHSAPQMAAVRETLNQFAFRAATTGRRRRRQQTSAATVLDHNAALSIAAGADSWSQIGHMPKQAVADVGVMLSAHIPQRSAAKTTTAPVGGGGDGREQLADAEPDPATDPNFREPVVDEMRAEKDAELFERRRDLDVREQFHSMASLADSGSDF